MKPVVVFVTILSLFLPECGLRAQYQGVHVSVLLSGHIMIGVGYEYGLDDRNGLQATAFLAPESGIPFSLTAGYVYHFDNGRWRTGLGMDAGIIVSPDIGEGRKNLYLLSLTPQYGYYDSEGAYGIKAWLSWLPFNANHSFAPTGLELFYGPDLK